MKKKFLLIILVLTFFSNIKAKDSLLSATYKTIAFNNKGDTVLAGNSMGHGFIIKISKQNTISTKFFDLNGDVIKTIIYVKDNYGWMMNLWSLYRTNDDGESWIMQSIPQIKRFHSIDFHNAKQGWVAGDNADDSDEISLYKTIDGGISWKKLNLPTQAFEVRKIRFADENHGWIRTFNGFHCKDKCISYFRTNDGGETWIEMSLDGKSPNWYDFQLTDYRKGFAVSDKLYSTINSGRTWNASDINENYSLQKIFFLNEKKGWIWGEDFLKTNDGGKTWKHFKPKGFEEDIDEVKFLNDKIGWAIKYYSRSEAAYFTKDGGKTWKLFPNEWKDKIFDEIYKKRFPDIN